MSGYPEAGRLRWGADGLIPAVVRDVADGEVLMLAYMDAEAYERTTTTGEVHFHSRSRGRLWRKGESSGNVLRVREIALDCDADALLVSAEPAGPTCHTGARSCFAPAGSTYDAAPAAPDELPALVVRDDGFSWLDELWATIVSRAAERPEGSYTVALIEGGVDAAARKVTEEATEVLVAAKDDAVAEAIGDPSERDASRRALVAEAADLIYHLLVLLRERNLPPGRVLDELRARHGS